MAKRELRCPVHKRLLVLDTEALKDPNWATPVHGWPYRCPMYNCPRTQRLETKHHREVEQRRGIVRRSLDDELR